MTTSRPAPRIAIGGFMLESNSHGPVATRAEFEANVLLAGDALAADLDVVSDELLVAPPQRQFREKAAPLLDL